MTELDLSIIIPVYNESTKVAQDIFQASQFLTNAGLKGEILIVDDGSTDQTVHIAKQVAASQSVPCHILPLKKNQGKGNAVKTGILASKGRIVLFADSGCCVPYALAKTGMDLIESQGCALAIGSRRHPQSIIHRDQTKKRRLYSRLFKLVLSTLFPSLRPLTDTQCGFKVFKGDTIRQLFQEATLQGFLFDIDIILLAQSKGHTVCEFPIEWTCDPDSRLSANQHTKEILQEVQHLRQKYKSKF